MRQTGFLANTAGATAAEFALILPIALLFLLGLIDVGRYAWAFNQAEKATQVGARWAAATDYVPAVLNSYKFAIAGAVPQGTTVPQSKFPGITCQAADVQSNVACTCKASSSATGFCSALAPNNAAFNRLASRMSDIYGGVGREDIIIDYDWSGLGYSGDPNGSDVAPIITVRLKDTRRFPLWFLLGATVPFPDARYSITGEDGQGICANTGGC